ncbi:hypothetical protein OUZ56_011838 [Daphnia magna]|uniref:Uncharacterized protein n=1 Tax=Daphnia magna TaxID=35525 RepID=A0ABQ9Z1F0_9CRUS|nr:hypothetical protein OUZ56_011838 [Daphnia magna]
MWRTWLTQAKFTSKLSSFNPTPKSSSKTSFLSRTILSFFKRKNTTNGKTVDTESSSPIQRDHEESGEDFPDSEEQVAILNTSHQEPEGERGRFPVERQEDPDPTNLVAEGHPIDISLSGQPADNGVEETNVSSEIFDGGLEEKLTIRAKTTKKTEQQAFELTAIFTTYARHFLTFLFGQIYNITDLRKLTQTKNKNFCAILPNVRITGSDPCPILKKPSVTYAIGTTDPGDKITSDKTGQLPSSHQTKQRAVGGEDQTNANPNQNKLETEFLN